MTKPRILCLHGKAQTAESFPKKIGGARRKLERAFDLTFLDGPIDLEEVSQSTTAPSASAGSDAETPMFNTARAWFLREPLEDNPEQYRYLKLAEAMTYVSEYALKHGPFDGLMVFFAGWYCCNGIGHVRGSTGSSSAHRWGTSYRGGI